MVKMGGGEQNKNRKLCLQIYASLNFNNFMSLLCQLQRKIAFLDFDIKIMKFSVCFGNNQSYDWLTVQWLCLSAYTCLMF